MTRQKPKSEGHRLAFLEGVRGYLALWVMIGHFLYFLSAGNALTRSADFPPGFLNLVWLLQNGEIPVAMFMILSGFVITLLLRTKKEAYGVFITRRFLRLFPAYAVCFFIGFAINSWQQNLVWLPWGTDPWVENQARLAVLHQQHWLANVLAHLTILHGAIPKYFVPDARGAFLGVAWSISTEWQFYLIAPFLLWMASRFRGLFVICVLLVSMSVFSPMRYTLAEWFEQEPSFLPFYLIYFWIGGLSYEMWSWWNVRVRPEIRDSLALQGLILCGATLAACFVHFALALWIFCFFCLVQLSVNSTSSDSKCASWLFCSKPVLFCGRISYSIYLLHWPIAIALLNLYTHNKFFGMMPRELSFTTGAIFIAVATCCTLVGSTILYHLVEAPAIAWGKRLFGKDAGNPPLSQAAS